jgi:hypothetical protein
MNRNAADLSESEPLGLCTPLVPQPRIWLRTLIVVLSVAIILIGQPSWLSLIGFCLTMAGFFGTFSRATISAEYFEKESFVCFVPVGISRTRLANVVQIETDVESSMEMEGSTVPMWSTGVFDLLFVWLLDWLIPWVRGEYKLWFRMQSEHSDQRALVWQGNGESNFRYNLELLEQITGMPVTRG